MIKVNLCPVEELESPYWYVPDLTVAIGVALAGYFAVQYYLGSIRDEMDHVNQSVSSLETSTSQLEPDLKRFESLDQDIRKLNEKIAALQNITVSKIERLKPLILLEHLQNIKPPGVWYQSIEIGASTAGSFKLSGQSFDNILIAEFMMALRSTETQDVDPADLRTQVYFTNLVLKGAELKKGAVSGYSDLKDMPSFEVRGSYGDRVSNNVPARTPSPEAKKVSSQDDAVKADQSRRF